MEVLPCIEEMKSIQDLFLDFIENEENIDDNYDLTNYNYFKNLNAQEKCYKLIEIIKLISKILDNHHHTNNFFTKIEQILSHFKEDIRQSFSNEEIFNFFCQNKRILLYLFKEKMLTINDSIAFWLCNNKKANYYDYFSYEILSFFKGEQINRNEENFDIFNKKRKTGENDNYICNLIRNDLIEEFIAYTNKTNLSLSTIIKPSIFEANQFLIDKEPTLIEYSAFFGSIQIFKYLQMKKVELGPSLWIYAIHSNNADLIHLLEENNVKPNDNNYDECFTESIKCNHINFAKYIQNTYMPDIKDFSKEIIKYRNYNIFPNNLSSPEVIYNLVKYNYPFTVDYLLNNTEIDINYRYVITTKQILAKRHNEEDTFTKEIKQTLIYIAILKENKEIVKILLSNPKINIKEKMINTQRKGERIQLNEHFPIRYAINKVTGNPLHFAIETGNIEIVQIVLSHPDIDINELLEEYEYENIETRGLHGQLFKNMEMNVKKSPLHIALNKKYADIALILLSKKIELKNEIKEGKIKKSHERERKILEEKAPLYIAIQNGLNDIIKYLLLKCNVNVNDNTIRVANDDDYYYIDEEEYESEAKTTALFVSVDKENVEIVRFLLSFPNIDVNICPEDNKSTLHLAIEKENIEIVKLLLSNQKIDVNSYCVYKQKLDNGCQEIIERKTPLYLAVERENIEIVKLLISHPNIDINANCRYKQIIYENRFTKETTTKKVMTILHLVVEKENIELLTVLLSNPNLNIFNKFISKKTIMDHGYNSDYTKVFKDEKTTALQFAIEHKNKEIINLFLNGKQLFYNPS